MISFRQFLKEVEAERPIPRAKKLFHYITKRRDKYNTDISYNRSQLGHVYTKNIIPDFTGYPDYSDVYEFSHTVEGGNLEHIPVKKIRSHQTDVGIDAMPGKIERNPIYPDNPEHPEVIYNHVHDIYHLKDGNHRVASALLRRDKTIQARVWYMKKRRE